MDVTGTPTVYVGMTIVASEVKNQTIVSFGKMSGQNFVRLEN